MPAALETHAGLAGRRAHPAAPLDSRRRLQRRRLLAYEKGRCVRRGAPAAPSHLEAGGPAASICAHRARTIDCMPHATPCAKGRPPPPPLVKWVPAARLRYLLPLPLLAPCSATMTPAPAPPLAPCP
eukprot:365052-Chlamydomonas_euryale.AAC.6